MHGALRNVVVVVVVAACIASASCLPALTITEGARLQCAEDDECPAGTFCLDDIGLCSSGGPCLVQGEETVVADGTPCGDDGGNICFEGACVAPFCGDGVVDLSGGERCDPGANARCRADCTPQVCGDGIVDDNAGESCDERTPECRGCFFGCPSEAPFADCDLDPSTSCECDVTTLEELGAEHRLIGAAFIDGGYAYADMKLDDLFIDIARVVDGNKIVVGTDLFYGDVARVGDKTFISTNDNDVSVLTVEDASGGEPVELIRRTDDNPLTYLFKDESRLFGRTYNGIVEIVLSDDGTSASERFIRAECVNDFDAAAVCGDRIACWDRTDAELRSFDLNGEDVVLLDKIESDAAVSLIPGCIGGVFHWHDTANVYRSDGAGGRVVVATAGPGGLATFGTQEARLVAGRLFLFSSFHSLFGGELSLFALDLEKSRITVIYEGNLLDERDGVILIGNEEGRLSQLTLSLGGGA